MSINTVPTLSINECARALITSGHLTTIYISGEPGIGKTSLLRLMQERMGDAYDYIYLDIPAMDQSDMFMRIPDRDSKKLEQYFTSLFDTTNGKPKVVCVDEFSKGANMTRLLMTRFLLEQTLGDWKLPAGSKVFATGNNTSDGVGDTLRGHEGNRITHINMRKPTPAELIAYGFEKGWSDITLSWIATNPTAFASYRDGDQDANTMIFNPRRAGGNISFVTPRSVEKADTAIIKNRAVLGETLTLAMLAGTIGLTAALKMVSYFKLEKEVTKFEDIVADPVNAMISAHPAVLFQTMFNTISGILTQDDLSACITYFKRSKSDELMGLYMTLLHRNKKAGRLAASNAECKNWARTDNNFELLL
jgi:hypothetical protein